MPEKANHVRGGRAMTESEPDPASVLRRKLYRAAKQSRSRRFHALYDKLLRRDILERAFTEVARNRGAPGADGVTTQTIEASGVDAFLDELQAELKEDRYRPAPVRRVSIPKRDGGGASSRRPHGP
jgi:RNA-directed DNA polymerase